MPTNLPSPKSELPTEVYIWMAIFVGAWTNVLEFFVNRNFGMTAFWISGMVSGVILGWFVEKWKNEGYRSNDN